MNKFTSLRETERAQAFPLTQSLDPFLTFFPFLLFSFDLASGRVELVDIQHTIVLWGMVFVKGSWKENVMLHETARQTQEWGQVVGLDFCYMDARVMLAVCFSIFYFTLARIRKKPRKWRWRLGMGRSHSLFLLNCVLCQHHCSILHFLTTIKVHFNGTWKWNVVFQLSLQIRTFVFTYYKFITCWQRPKQFWYATRFVFAILPAIKQNACLRKFPHLRVNKTFFLIFCYI